MVSFSVGSICDDTDYGTGNVGDKAIAACKEDEMGDRTAVCQKNGEWEEVENNCVLREVQLLLEQSEVMYFHIIMDLKFIDMENTSEMC